MTSPRLIRVCASCGWRWAGNKCRHCGGLHLSRVSYQTSVQIVARYQDALLAKIDGPIPIEWEQIDAEAEETDNLLFGEGGR